jgi:hypothetical protein
MDERESERASKREREKIIRETYCTRYINKNPPYGSHLYQLDMRYETMRELQGGAGSFA